MVYETTDCAELSTTTALCKQNVFPFCIKYLIESNDFFLYWLQHWTRKTADIFISLQFFIMNFGH